MRSLVLILMVGALAVAVFGCSEEEPPGPPPPVAGETELDLYEGTVPSAPPTYDNVAKLLRGDPAVANDSGLCAYSGCHGGTSRQAGLNFRGSVFDDAQVYRALVEGDNGPVQACEYHPLRRVEPGNPSRSWLYIKLAGETDARDRILVSAADDWDESGSLCRSDFPGSLMPFSEDEPVFRLEPAQLRMVAEWILDGAPGPVTQ